MLKDDIILNLQNDSLRFERLKAKLNTKTETLKKALAEMLEDGLIVCIRGFYGILRTGKVIAKDQGYGFITTDEEKDFYLPDTKTYNVYDGDIVSFIALDMHDKLLEAIIYQVIKRNREFIIGNYLEKIKKGKKKFYIKSNNLKFPITAKLDRSLDVEPNTIVYAPIMYVGTDILASNPVILGHKDDPGIEISQIALEYGFKQEFSLDVIKEISNIPDEVLVEEKTNRKDFTDKLIFTIDGDDSKDFDDAVSLEKDEEGNYLLGVYIADVSHYVKEGMPLDKDALARGTSVYLADRVIPMIPHKLSNGICSLNEGVERLVMACLMKISPLGKLLDYQIVEGVIKSRHRMTYNNVNKILDNDQEMCEKYADLVPTLKEMYKLSQIIRKLRDKKGALEFDVKEYKFDLNPDGSPKSVILRTRAKAERLIEDFMLIANETVAYNMSIMNLPCVYRIHEKPDQDKLLTAFMQLQMMGLDIELPKKNITNKYIQKALADVEEDNILKPIANDLLLRSMMKAKYDPKCLGHYGLAMQYYCHFTSPIRRYPDLMVHRLIKKLFLHPTTELASDINHYNSIINEIALMNSNSEKNAVECERSINDMLYAWYMEENINSTFEGIITTTTSFGIFVSLDNGVEGLIHFSSLDGYYELNKKDMSVSNGKKTYHLGQKVKVVVVGASKLTRKIDLMFLEDYMRDK